MGKVFIFIFSFIFVLVFYELFTIRKAKKKDAKDKPIEVKYLINRYKVNLKKADYNQMLQITALVSSLDIAVIITVISFFERINIQILVAFIMVIPIILISYHVVGCVYRKKGLVKDE